MILSLIRNLPEGSRFNATLAVDHPQDPAGMTDPRLEAIADQRAWTLDRRLQAMEINAINMNTAVTGQWKDKPPEFPTIGPADWQGPPDSPKTAPAYTDNFDFFQKMGWPTSG